MFLRVVLELGAGAGQVAIGLGDQVVQIMGGRADPEAARDGADGGHQDQGPAPAEGEKGVPVV